MQEIAPGVFVETGYQGANVGFVVTDEGVVLIDTPMLPSQARHWRQQIALTTEQPVVYVFNTDYHRGHILGNQFFPAPVIAHDAAWEQMKGYSDAFRQQCIDLWQELDPEGSFERPEIILPELTFTRRIVLHRGQRTMHLIHMGGHTPATSILYLPEEGIAFTGDLVFNNILPSLRHANTKQWLEALTALRKMRVDVIVPGHGEICGKEATQRLSEFIREVRAQVRQLYKAGRSKSEVSSKLTYLLDFFPAVGGEREKLRQRFKAGIDRVYDEMKQTSK